ncbi:MAG: hypothetical protein HUJ69_02610 [Lachnospiraceae bacterium]|nr:hypothetical protein [Lachnospiraceae bacterium]
MNAEYQRMEAALEAYRDYEGLCEIDREEVRHRGLQLTWNREKSLFIPDSPREDGTVTTYVRAEAQTKMGLSTGCVVREGGDPSYDELLKEALTLGRTLGQYRKEPIREKAEYHTGVFESEAAGDGRSFSELRSLGENIGRQVMDMVPELKEGDFSLSVYSGLRIHREGTANNRGLAARDESCSYEIRIFVFDREYLLTAAVGEDPDMESLLDVLQMDMAIYKAEADESMNVKISGYEGPAVLSGAALNSWLITAWKHFTDTADADGTSCFAGKKGEGIGPELLSLWDVPEWKGRGYIRRTDSKGGMAREVKIIDRGYMQELLSSDRANAGRTATLVRSYGIQTVPRNTVLLPGEASLREMTDRGEVLYIYEIFDEFHGLDISTGIFNYPCKAALLKDGQVKGILERVTLTGNSREFLKNIETLGRDLLQQELVIMETYMVMAPAALCSHVKLSGNG